MSTFPSEQEHFDAIVALLETAQARPFDYDADPPKNTAWYTLVSVTDRFGGTMRMSGQVGVRGVRVALRAVGISPDNVRENRRRFDVALRERVITVGTHKSTPIQFETGEPVAQDGDIKSSGKQWYSALSVYVYTV